MEMFLIIICVAFASVLLLCVICAAMLSSGISRQEEQNPCRNCEVFWDDTADRSHCFGCERYKL